METDTTIPPTVVPSEDVVSPNACFKSRIAAWNATTMIPIIMRFSITTTQNVLKRIIS